MFVFILSKGSLPVFKGIFWWTNKKHVSVNYLTYNFWSRFVFRKHRLLANYFCHSMVQYVYEIWQFIIHVNGSHGYLFIPPLPQYFKGKRSRNFWKLFCDFFFMCYLVYRSINNAFNIAVVLGVIFKLTYMSHVGHIVGKK